MKAICALTMLWLFCATPAMAQRNAPAVAASSRTPPHGSINRHKLSYAIGYRIGSRFSDGHPAVDIDTLVKALRDAYAKHAPAVSMQDMDAQLSALEKQLRTRARASYRHLAKVNAARSAQFMAHNKQQPGVVSLPSGVQYKVLQRGSGVHPTPHSTVVLNYRGSLANGMEFDSSYAHGKAVTYPVDKMLAGWRDVLPRMRVGGKWKVFIPPSQAFGIHGQLPRIGPNEALVFEIKLLKVK